MAYFFSRCAGLAFASLMVLATGANAGELAPDLTPKPGLTATEVVRIQLSALANNDSPRTDAGIEITFRFASPANKRVTGPLPRFIKLLKSAAYRPMLNHRRSEFGDAVIEEGHT